MHNIQWGIIGCGNVTEVKSGPAFSKVDGSELRAVMRRDAAKAKDYAARHNVPRWYNDASKLIEDAEVNAVYIATPPSSHEEYAMAAIRAGKPVYLEKPMSTNYASAQRIEEAAEKYNVKVCVAHYRRYLPMFLHIKQLLDQKIIGKVRSIQLQLWQSPDKQGFEPLDENWRLQPAISGGGIFHDLAPHQLDLLYYYFGEPSDVKGLALNQARKYVADDIVSGLALFPGDIVFTGSWCFTVSAGDERDLCCIAGSEGSLQFSVFKMDNLTVQTKSDQKEYTFDVPKHVQQPMISEVVKYFQNRRDNPCSAHDGVVVMRIIRSIVG
jgi:predicted dehydrogenase